jgi:ribosomal protein L35
MKQKTQKSLSKRIKVTRTGKMIIRKGRQDHFNARDTGKQVLNKRRDQKLSDAFRKSVQTLMPHSGA